MGNNLLTRRYITTGIMNLHVFLKRQFNPEIAAVEMSNSMDLHGMEMKKTCYESPEILTQLLIHFLRAVSCGNYFLLTELHHISVWKETSIYSWSRGLWQGKH